MDQGAVGQQAEGVGQGYAFSQQGGDDALPFVQRSPEPSLNKLLGLQLVTDAAQTAVPD